MRVTALAALMTLLLAAGCGQGRQAPPAAAATAKAAPAAAAMATSAPVPPPDETPPPAAGAQPPADAPAAAAPPTQPPPAQPAPPPATAPPARPNCAPTTPWRMSAYSLGANGPVRVTWSVPGPCPPYTGTLTSSAGLRRAVTGSGQYDDQPPAGACKRPITYTLTLADATGFGWPPMSMAVPAYC